MRREWQEKTDLVDREEDDTVEYSIKNKWIFRADLSGPGLTGEEMLVLPHVFILAMVMTTVREKPTMVPVVSKYIIICYYIKSSISTCRY